MMRLLRSESTSVDRNDDQLQSRIMSASSSARTAGRKGTEFAPAAQHSDPGIPIAYSVVLHASRSSSIVDMC